MDESDSGLSLQWDVIQLLKEKKKNAFMIPAIVWMKLESVLRKQPDTEGQML